MKLAKKSLKLEEEKKVFFFDSICLVFFFSGCQELSGELDRTKRTNLWLCQMVFVCQELFRHKKGNGGLVGKVYLQGKTKC